VAIAIRSLRPSELDLVRPFWLATHAHHQAVAPELAPYVDDATSWRCRSALYNAAIESGGAVLVAADGETFLGYAVWRDERMPWPAAFATAPRYAEILSVAVVPSRRGEGIATALLTEVDRQTAARGYTEQMVNIVPGNLVAFDLFFDRGFVSKWLVLTCFRRELTVPPSPAPVDIEDVPLSELGALTPIWVSVHHQHQAVAPHLAPFVTDEETWHVYSKTFRSSAEQGLVFRVGSAEQPVAMGCASMLDDMSRFADTWHTHGPIAEIEVLAALPGARGKGYGTALMHTMRDRLHERGIRDMVIGAVAANADAIRLYEKWDFRPACLQMTKRCA
jgi:ribosomal protein S18 acetylase RimI-like enzyme